MSDTTESKSSSSTSDSWKCPLCDLYNNNNKSVTICQACFELRPDLIAKSREWGALLLDESVSIARRMRTCFMLKDLGTIHAIRALNRGFLSKSALLKHECAYVMGQMSDPSAVPFLINVLCNEKQQPIVRHEAAEALGAIGEDSKEVIKCLTKYSKHDNRDIRETCLLALDGFEYVRKQKHKKQKTQQRYSDDSSDSPHHSDSDSHSMQRFRVDKSKFASIDPAPPLSHDKSIKELSQIFLDKNESLFRRYRAMFSLRDLNNDESVKVLCKGFDDDSALLRHEIAFVLGQMNRSSAVNALRRVLVNSTESGMVRHEAAEALGDIAEDSALPTLRQFADDSEMVVKESVDVALDMHRYWKSEEFDMVVG